MLSPYSHLTSASVLCLSVTEEGREMEEEGGREKGQGGGGKGRREGGGWGWIEEG